MKKITLIAIAAVFFASCGLAAAATPCGQADANGSIVACGNGSPELVVNVWGTSNSGVPHVLAGSTVYDEAGIAFSCPAWYGMLGCSDITHTDYYRSAARFTAKQMQSGGYAIGQSSYWLTH